MKMKRIQRSQGGASLVSLLVATTIMSFVAISIMSLMSLNTAEANKAFNRADTLTSARTALDKMGRLIRMSRTVGDIQGMIALVPDSYSAFPSGMSVDTSKVVPNGVDPTDFSQNEVVSSSSRFPSDANVLYGGSNPTMKSVPFPPAPWPSAPYQLDQQTLILQVQTFSPAGYPRKLNTSGSMANTVLPALDTYVYRVVPDSSRPDVGQTRFYQLQLTIFPAPAGLTNMPPNIQPGVPQTVLSGLVGPLDQSGNPAIFQYLDPVTGGKTTMFNDNVGMVNYRGVIVNMQVLALDAARKPTMTTLRSEFFLRNNSQATITTGAI